MGRKSAANVKEPGRLRRAAEAVKRLLTRGRGDSETVATSAASTQQQKARATAEHPSRPVQRQSDIPLERVESEYIPPITSSKASFRSNGADHESDQDAFAADRFNDEDHYTNKSKDPRIGTHGRHSATSETRAESRE